ncbi:hypothetical protein PPERSA_08570 [Pseudocohnilembus persalinus]|uniref:Uncharacterized protein n=1 Tax=Pseudocohnilembus persalinus TaxID=266149 RepID=A0A0V0R6Q4_PSEPJ|nr:hypothetical protein PPERSA_08570 [Pseudocohnilembus persalinus]|eukprot:KRX10167.1 hypothetical protein PPERSA_08570 [Pseudocohnilembus persalinus]
MEINEDIQKFLHQIKEYENPNKPKKHQNSNIEQNLIFKNQINYSHYSLNFFQELFSKETYNYLIQNSNINKDDLIKNYYAPSSVYYMQKLVQEIENIVANHAGYNFEYLMKNLDEKNIFNFYLPETQKEQVQKIWQLALWREKTEKSIIFKEIKQQKDFQKELNSLKQFNGYENYNTQKLNQQITELNNIVNQLNLEKNKLKKLISEKEIQLEQVNTQYESRLNKLQEQIQLFSNKNQDLNQKYQEIETQFSLKLKKQENLTQENELLQQKFENEFLNQLIQNLSSDLEYANFEAAKAKIEIATNAYEVEEYKEKIIQQRRLYQKQIEELLNKKIQQPTYKSQKGL